jgi:sugar (pentulose or hexulose) kinase
MAEHGTLSGYNNDNCRCDLCREAQRDVKRRYRQTEKGRATVNRHARMQGRMKRAALRWIKENEPEVYKQIWKESRE